MAVREVVDEGDRIAHVLAAPLDAGPVECSLDWDRRFDHMQQHTGQHLLSAVFEELFSPAHGQLPPGGRKLHHRFGGWRAGCRARPPAPKPRQPNRLGEPARVGEPTKTPPQVQGLRKASEREGTLRIVSIDGLDRSACGGTHVRATGEIGAVLLRKLEKVRQTVRVEFLCGGGRCGARAPITKR